MVKAATILRGVVRGAGVVLLALGVLFWSNRATGLIPLHIGLGVAFVLSLIALGVLALRGEAGAGRLLPIAAIVWGVVVWALGFAQGDLLPGPMHWVVKVLHLLVGLAAMGLGERVGARLTRPQPGSTPTRPAVPGDAGL